MTVVEVHGLGHCGGLLVLNAIGRPLEFHCTAPVANNRAQQILYGKTYFSYLYCDQIGLALVAKTKTKPTLLITNRIQMMPMADLVPQPLVLVTLSEEPGFGQSSSTQTLDHFRIHDQAIWTQNLEPATLSIARELCIEFSESIPLDEPFERIEQAIEEAQAVVR